MDVDGSVHVFKQVIGYDVDILERGLDQVDDGDSMNLLPVLVQAQVEGDVLVSQVLHLQLR